VSSQEQGVTIGRMIVRNFQRNHSTFPFSSETINSLSSIAGSGDQCIHHQLYGQFDLEIICFDGKSGAHQAVLGQASKMVKEILIGDTWLLDNGDVLNVVNSRKTMRTMFLPDIKKSTVKNILSVLYTGDVVMNSVEEAGEMKALWRLLKIDLIHTKDLQILFATDSSNSKLNPCEEKCTEVSKSNNKHVANFGKKRSRFRRTKLCVSVKKRMLKIRKVRKPSNRKLLHLFEKILAETQTLKFPANVTNAEKEHNENVEEIQPRATIIQPIDTILTESALSYEDQNFSYNINLISSENMEHNTPYHTQDTNFHSQDTHFHSQDTPFQSQDTTYESQEATYQEQCIPFLQEDSSQAPLQIPLSYLHKPSIFVPVSFSDQMIASSSNFSYLSSTSQEVSRVSLSTLLPIPREELVNLEPKYVTAKIPQIQYDTDGFDLQPNIQNLENPDILDSIRKSFELYSEEEDIFPKRNRKIPKKIPRFRENNNWLGKDFVNIVPPEERANKYDYKSSKKITLVDRNVCKKKNMIKDNLQPLKINIKQSLEINNDLFKKSGGVKKGNVETGRENKNITNLDDDARYKYNKLHEGTHKTSTQLNRETKGCKTTNIDIPCFKYFEEPKYQMDEKLIQNYLKNQSKLKVINKWKIDRNITLYDKSNDKYLRRESEIRTSLVNLPNVLQTPDCRLYCPEEATFSSKKTKPSLCQLTPISRLVAWKAVRPVAMQEAGVSKLDVNKVSKEDAKKDVIKIKILNEKQVSQNELLQVYKKVEDQVSTSWKGVNQDVEKDENQASVKEFNQALVKAINPLSNREKNDKEVLGSIISNVTQVSIQKETQDVIEIINQEEDQGSKECIQEVSVKDLNHILVQVTNPLLSKEQIVENVLDGILSYVVN